MVTFLLNGNKLSTQNNTSIRTMIELFAPLEQEDMMYFITVNGHPIQGRTDQVFVCEGDEIKLIKMVYGG